MKSRKSNVSDAELIALVNRCAESLESVLTKSGLPADDVSTQLGCLSAIYDTVKAAMEMLVEENRQSTDEDEEEPKEWVH